MCVLKTRFHYDRINAINEPTTQCSMKFCLYATPKLLITAYKWHWETTWHSKGTVLSMTKPWLHRQNFKRWIGTSESTSVVVTLGPEQHPCAKLPAKFPQGMSKGKFQRDGSLLRESEPRQQVANSCLTAEKETQSTLKIPSLLQWPYCVEEGAKGLKWEGQLRP